MERSRTENLDIITALSGADPAQDEAVHNLIEKQLGMEALSDAALALMADAYLRLATGSEPAPAPAPAGAR